MTQQDIAEIDPLDHHYIKEGHFGVYQRDRNTLTAANEQGRFANPYGWDYKAAERAVNGQWQNAYKEDVRRAAILMEAERVRPKTKGEQWHAQSQMYFHDIEDKILSAIAAEMYRQWAEERAAKAKSAKQGRIQEVKRTAEALTAQRMACEATGASIVGPTRTVASTRVAHSMMPATHIPPPMHTHMPATMMHTHVPPASYCPPPQPMGFGTYCVAQP